MKSTKRFSTGFCSVLYMKPTWCKIFLSMFISFLYMFRANMFPSSGDTTVFIRHLALVILYGYAAAHSHGVQEHMLRANMCPSSGETTVFMRLLVLVILYGWLSGMQVHMFLHTRSMCSCIPDSHPYGITKTNCHISTVVSPDDGHKVARNL